ncbi:MAG: ABC transporter substrate-binding protein [Mesorhizobium sp.]|nr:MAG: ABC transporter substrate-binding protein [Mesorhizobium sp.]
MVGDYRFKKDCAELLQEEMSKGHLSRRDFLRASAALGLTISAVGAGLGGVHAETETITLCNYGGPAVDAMKASLVEPFKADTGIDVAFDTSGPIVGRLKKMVDDGATIWDVIDGGPFYGYQLGDRYLEAIDYSVVDKSKIFDWAQNDYAAGSYVYSNVLAYDSAKLKRAPTGWADFFDTEKFPGKRALYKWFDGAPESCLLGLGKSKDQLYPMDWDVITKAIDKLGDNLVLWDSGSVSMQLFLDEEIVMGNIWNTRARVLERDTKGRVKWIWNQQIVAPASWCIPKGSKHVAATQKFIASAQAPDRQIKLLEALGNGPANPQALATLNDDQKRVNPTSHLDVGVVEDMKWYADNYDEAVDKWTNATTR